MKMF